MSNRDKTVLTFSIFLSVLIVNSDKNNGVNYGLLGGVQRIAILTIAAYVLSWLITYAINRVLWEKPKE